VEYELIYMQTKIVYEKMKIFINVHMCTRVDLCTNLNLLSYKLTHKWA
jgi:hypothetical protein